MSDPHNLSADRDGHHPAEPHWLNQPCPGGLTSDSCYADDCGVDNSGQHCEFAAQAVQRLHYAITELQERELADRAARIERLTRWTAGDREAARVQEEAASDDTAH